MQLDRPHDLQRPTSQGALAGKHPEETPDHRRDVARVVLRAAAAHLVDEDASRIREGVERGRV